MRGLSIFRSAPPAAATPAADLGYQFALVDVETTGLNARSDRVVQIAVRQLDRYGATQQTWHTLVDPGCDPGPTHIHGITRQMLVGAPSFQAVAPVVADLVAGRILVAHNASFDWGFLQAESVRAASTLDCTQRLCTLALARRLDLNVPNFKLGTLARWADIRQQQAHSAVDDTRVLEAVFLKLIRQAIDGGVTLPMSSNTATVQPWVERAPAVNSPWQPCGHWDGVSPLVQGMKFVVTGHTRNARAEIYGQGIATGLVPMNTVSSKTNALVCNDLGSGTVKASRAAQFSVPVISEDRFLTLLHRVLPGAPLSERRPVIRVSAPIVTGPLTSCRVLVLGGPHEHSAKVRDEVMARGGRVAVNMTPTVTHLVGLYNAARDPRFGRASHLLRLDPTTLEPFAYPPAAAVVAEAATITVIPAPPDLALPIPAPPDSAPREPVEPAVVEPAHPEPAAPEPQPELRPARILRHGEVADLPAEINRWDLFVSWTLADPPLELDVVAFVTDADEKVLSDAHFVFFNALESPGGEVQLEPESNGETRLSMDLDELAVPGLRVIVGASLAGGRTFGELGPVELTLRDPDGAPWARTVLDAGTTEQSLVLADFYQRNGQWRVRAIGQGYEEQLAEFAVRHGVDVG